MKHTLTSTTKPSHHSWSMFSQDHCAKVLLGWDVDSMPHDAALDAQKSVGGATLLA